MPTPTCARPTQSSRLWITIMGEPPPACSPRRSSASAPPRRREERDADGAEGGARAPVPPRARPKKDCVSAVPFLFGLASLALGTAFVVGTVPPLFLQLDATDAAPKHYNLRNVSQYAVERVGQIHRTSVSTSLNGSGCVRFACSKNATRCDNAWATDYDGPAPPCCTHVLRDMARAFDEEMAALGLEYAAAFGTLLGLRRADRMIPWTADGDYVVTQETANAMVSLWDARRTGLAHLFQGINRMCVTADFARAGIRKWIESPPFPGSTLPKHNNIDLLGFPYIDLYVGNRTHVEGLEGVVFDLRGGGINCRHLYRDIFSSQRVSVYNRSFFQSYPSNPDQLLRTSYGPDWMVPLSNKSEHGNGRTGCLGPMVSS